MNARIGIHRTAFLAAGLCLCAAGAASGEVVINLDQSPPKKSTEPPARTAPPAAVPAPATHHETPKPDEGDSGKIEGVEIPRGADGYAGIKIEGGVFEIRFYDSRKKPIAPDVSKAALRWPVTYQPNDERAFLTVAPDGMSLTSAKVVRPPFRFRLYITFLNDDKDGELQVKDQHVVEFQQ